jgi:hypothetical protein
MRAEREVGGHNRRAGEGERGTGKSRRGKILFFL